MDESTRATLIAEGMQEVLGPLEAAGMYRLRDISATGATEADLEHIGISKLFHRKKLLRMSAESAGDEGGTATPEQRRTGAAAESPSISRRSSLQSAAGGSVSPSGRESLEGGDHVAVHVMAVRSVGSKQLSEREHYVKVSLCDLVGTCVVPLGDTVFRTEDARGPFPTFISDSALPHAQPILVPTNFRTHCIAFELKEHRLLTDNNYIGAAVFPISYFHRFTPTTVVDSWFTLRSQFSTRSESIPTGQIRVRLAVPGGCPKAVRRAYHVTGVNMRERKLRVTVFEAEVVQTSRGGDDYFHAAPSTFASLILDQADDHQRCETQVVDNSYTPCFDETFEYFHEIAHAKLLTVKLKQRASLLSNPTIGTVRIPLQFFLSQTAASDIDEVFDAFDHDDTSVVRARIHLRVEVRKRRSEERSVNFMRTESIKQQRFLGPPPPPVVARIDGDERVGSTPRAPTEEPVVTEPPPADEKWRTSPIAPDRQDHHECQQVPATSSATSGTQHPAPVKTGVREEAAQPSAPPPPAAAAAAGARTPLSTILVESEPDDEEDALSEFFAPRRTPAKRSPVAAPAASSEAPFDDSFL